MAVVISTSRTKQDRKQCEQVFLALDRISFDVSNCKLARKSNPIPVLHDSDFKGAKFISPWGWIAYRFDQTAGTLKRIVPDPNGEPQTILDGVANFFITYFPESESVLYRIELNDASQVRGYLFVR